MRIVDVCAFYSPSGGGVRTYIERKFRALPALGHEIIVVAPGPRDEVIRKRPGALLVNIASPALPVDKRYHYFDDRAALHDSLDRLRPDLVEASSPWSSATKVAEWQGAAPRVLMMHADPLAAYAYRWLGPVASNARIDRLCEPFWKHLRTLDASFDLVVSPGASLSRRLTVGGLEKVVTNPLGVEPGTFNPARARPAMRQTLLDRLKLPDDGLILIAVGRFASEKRWPMVIRAAASAARRRPVGLLLIGGGAREEEIRLAAKESSHVDVMDSVGDRAELATLMASADALVHGCESETFCLVASEARSSGLPLIVPDRGGAFDQLDAAAGLAYTAGDATALRNTIVTFYDAQDTFASRTNIASRVRTMDEHFADLCDHYERLVGGQQEVRHRTVSPVRSTRMFTF